jgi:enoyl-CoA hydratase
MTLEQMDDVAVLRLDNGRANAIDPELLDTLEDGLDAFDASGARALVITGYDRFFSAGLDLPTVSTYGRDTLGAFMRRFESVMDRIFALPRPVVAAVNGHAVAGGCVLAAQADHRVLAAAGAKYGVNEVRLGVGLPPSAVEALRATAPPASAAQAATSGALYDPDQALAMGLVDELAPAGEVLDRALAHARTLAAVPAGAFAQAKAAWRAPAVARKDSAREASLQGWLDLWFGDDAQAALAAAVASLTKKG